MSADPRVPRSPEPQPASKKETSQHPADREDIVETQPVDSPEQDVLTLDNDDYQPTPSSPQQSSP